MTGGMAGIAGTVLVIYATILGPLIPDAAGASRHRLGAGRAGGDPDQPDHGAGPGQQAHRRRRDARGPVASSTMDAIVKGTAAGLELLLNISPC